MHDVNHAIANLRSLSGISTLDFDANGNLALVFNDEIDVNFARIDEKTIELWTEIEDIGRADDPKIVRRLMEANHLGEGTGCARIALAPDTDTFVLCERIQVEPLNGDQFSDRIIEFLKYATFWNSAEVGRAAMASRAGAPRPGCHADVLLEMPTAHRQ